MAAESKVVQAAIVGLYCVGTTYAFQFLRKRQDQTCRSLVWQPFLKTLYPFLRSTCVSLRSLTSAGPQ